MEFLADTNILGQLRPEFDTEESAPTFGQTWPGFGHLPPMPIESPDPCRSKSTRTPDPLERAPSNAAHAEWPEDPKPKCHPKGGLCGKYRQNLFEMVRRRLLHVALEAHLEVELVQRVLRDRRLLLHPLRDAGVKILRRLVLIVVVVLR